MQPGTAQKVFLLPDTWLCVMIKEIKRYANRVCNAEMEVRMKKYLWLFVAISLFTGAAASEVGAEYVLAKENDRSGGGLLREEIEISFSDHSTEDFFEDSYVVRRAASYRDETEKYGNYFVYNRLNDAERAYWDQLNEMCLGYLNTEINALSTIANGRDIFYLSGATSELLTKDEMKRVFSFFRYSNPQYYFINHQIISFQRNGRTYVSPGIYRAFADGAERRSVTEKMFAQVKKWEERVEDGGTQEEKIRLIHDLVTEKVTYNDAIYDPDFDEDIEYSQSSYSVFCMDKTVCAGYAQAFAMMCNSAGIDSYAVTSKTHEWNKVRIEDSWYNVDCTWDDSGDLRSYRYFVRSDHYYDTVSFNSAVSHKEEEFWDACLPPCTQDSTFADETYAAPGRLPVITAHTGIPAAVITPQDGMAQVGIFGGEEEAVYYYTLDGTQPSCASTKSRLYTEPFFVPWQTVISVLAVKDARLDSEVAKVTAVCSHAYRDMFVKEATCTEEGMRASICEYCGDSFGETAIAAEGHLWDGGVVAGDFRVFTCTKCHEKYTEQIPGLPDSGNTGETVNPGSPGDSGNTGGTVNPDDSGAAGGAGTPGSGQQGASNNPAEKKPGIGDTFKSGQNTYQVTKTGKSSEVKLAGIKKDAKSLVVPAKITYKGVAYKVTSVAKEACKNRKRLKTAELGKNVKTIGQSAFYGCTALKSVVIPKGVTEIGKKAFYGCKKLSDIKVKSTVLKSVGSKALKGISATAKIRVPAKKKTKYKTLFVKKGQGKNVKICGI